MGFCSIKHVSRMAGHGLTFIGLKNSTFTSAYGNESIPIGFINGTSTPDDSLLSSFAVKTSPEHAFWCGLLGMLLALLLKRGLTI